MQEPEDRKECEMLGITPWNSLQLRLSAQEQVKQDQ